MNTELYDLINLLDEYMETHTQINPKSIVNTLKQLNVECSPYGLRYDVSESGRRMDMIVFYYAGARYDITLIDEYIVSIDIDQKGALMRMDLDLLF